MLAVKHDMNHELVMPKNYVGLSEEEMEYDGGFLNFIVGVAVSAVGIGLSVAAAATGSQLLQTASNVATIAGAALSLGTAALVVGVAKGAVTTLTTQTIKGTLVQVTGQELKDAAAKAGAQIVCGDSLSLATGIGTAVR